MPTRRLAALVICAIAIATQLTLFAGPPEQTQTPSLLVQAQGLLRSNDVPGAIKLLEQAVTESPADVTAWRALGTAYQRANDADGAIKAFTTVLKLRPQSPQMIYNVGSAYAMKGDVESAFEWLAKAKATRRVDMSQLDSDTNLTPLRKDARYIRLRPTAADFDNPLVEDATILREWRGESAGEQFGWIARGIGDIDGDGVAEFVTSSPTKAIGGANAGRIFVFSPGTGSLLWSADGQPGDRLGIGVESAGDTNNDGVPDVIAGSPGGGYAKVYSGRNGTVLLTVKAEAQGEGFGRHCSGVGDVDRDGHADIIVGAPGNDAGGNNAGRAYLYSGKDGRVLATWTGERPGDAFGSTVSGQTKDGAALVLVGAPAAGPATTGRVYAYEGTSPKPKFTIEADETGVSLAAMFVAVPGDVNRDGVLDIFTTDFTNTARGPGTGRAVVHSGRDGKQLWAFTGENAGDQMGSSHAVVGDVNGDGHADLLVGAWQFAGAATSGGRVYLYSGKDGSVLGQYTCRTPGDGFGFDANGIGDINGDGIHDLLITAGGSGVNGFRSGRIFIISSGVSRLGGL